MTTTKFLSQPFKLLSDCTVSIIGDLLSGKAIQRKWHKHAIIALLGSILLYYILHFTFNKDVIWYEYAFCYLVPVGIMTVGCIVWEMYQHDAFGANVTPAEKFESWKDVFVGMYVSMIGVAIAMLIFKLK